MKQKKECPVCNYENFSDILVCGNCRYRFNLLCPYCGKLNPVSTRNCLFCEADLKLINEIVLSSKKGISLNKTELQKEEDAQIKYISDRRICSIMFAVIHGFNELYKNKDLEELKNLINNCFAVLGKVIEKYKGTIDKFIGNSIMVLFGAPTAFEDDAERAIKTAIEMLEGLAKFGIENKIPLNMSIGINTGLVVTGNVGFGEQKKYTVMGDNVNAAARLMTYSKKGSIIVSDSTYRIVKDIFRFKDFELIQVKGKTEPIKVCEVLRHFTTADYALEKYKDRCRRDFCASLIGRSKEIMLLKKIFKQSQSEVSQIIFLSGRGGYGKTRLIKEFIENIDGQEFQYYFANCKLIGQSSMFKPIVELLYSILNISKNDSWEQKEIKIDLFFKKHPDLTSEQMILLTEFISVKDKDIRKKEDIKTSYRKSKGKKEKMFASIIKLLETISKQQPVIYVFDDLQWADESTYDFLYNFLSELSIKNINIILSTRPEILKDNTRGLKRIYDTFENKANVHTISLKTLSEQDVFKFIKSYLSFREIDEFILQKIFNSSYGVPFYIEQIVNSLVDLRIIQKKEKVWNITGDLKQIVIPDSIRNILQSRLDILPENEKKILQYASVIGSEFDKNILSFILNMSDDIMDNGLNHLQRLIYITYSPLDETYQFISYLLKDTAYNTLLNKLRRQLHLMIIDYYELHNEKKDAKILENLYHHSQKSSYIEKELYYGILLGEKMEQSYVWENAISHYKKMIEKILTLEKKSNEVIKFYFQLNFNIGNIYLNEYLYNDAQPFLLKNLEIITDYSNLIDNEYLLMFYHKLARVYELQNNWKKMEEYLLKAIEFQELFGDDFKSESIIISISISYSSLARLNLYKNNFKKAEEFLLLAIENNKKLNDNSALSITYGQMANLKEKIGKYEEAKNYILKALELKNEENKNDRRWIISMQTLGRILLKMNDLSEAENYFKESLDLAYTLNNIIGQSIAMNHLADIYMEKMDFVSAIKYLKKSHETNININNKIGIFYNLVKYFDIYFKMENYEKAEKNIKESISMADEMKNFIGFMTANKKLADLFIAQNNLDEALSLNKETIATAQNKNIKDCIADLYLQRGQILEKLNKIKESKNYYKKSLEIYEELNLDLYNKQIEELNQKLKD